MSQDSQVLVTQAKEILRVLSHHSRLLEPSFKSSCFLELTRQHSTRHTSVIRPSSPSLPLRTSRSFFGSPPASARGPSDGPLVFGPVLQSQGCLGRKEGGERGRSIAAAAASSEVTIARHWADGRTDGMGRSIGRMAAAWLHPARIAARRATTTMVTPITKGGEGEKSLGFASTCTWSWLRFPIAWIGEVAIYISLKGKYRNSIQICIPCY